MKRIFVFALAVGIGSLVVSGQDAGDDSDVLKAKVDALEAELAMRLKVAKGKEDMRLVRRAYEIADLCGPVQDEVMRRSFLVPSDMQLPELAEDEPRSPYEVDAIIELIRVLAEPASWDSIEGADIMPRGTRLFATTIPRVHKKIGVLLAQFRRYLAPQIAVRVIALPVTAETAALLAARPRELTTAEAKQLAAIKPLGSARLVCTDGQQVVQQNGTRRGYIADYDVSIAEGAALAAPRRATVFEGCAVQVRGALDRSGRGVSLHVHLERSKLVEPVRTIETEHGPLDLPILEQTKVLTSLWAPLGKTVIVGGGGAGEGACFFLVTAERVEAK